LQMKLPSLSCSTCAWWYAHVATAVPHPKVEIAPRTELQHKCSRQISRSVRKQLEKEVLRVATREGVANWPMRCPFDPSRDLYGHHEKQKHRKRGAANQWTCGICNKVFRSEHYLDLHLERKHMSDAPRNGVCLADYCEIFDVCGGDGKFRRRVRHDASFECDNSSLAVARERCENAMAKCFPLDNQDARKLHAQFSRHFCQVLDCRIREERHREHHSDLMPVVVLLILVVLVCFIVFTVVVCCVDYSDDIFQFLVDSRLASTESVKGFVRARDKTRATMGMDRTRRI